MTVDLRHYRRELAQTFREIRRHQKTVICPPDRETEIRAVLAGLPWDVPLPRLVVSENVARVWLCPSEAELEAQLGPPPPIVFDPPIRRSAVEIAREWAFEATFLRRPDPTAFVRITGV